MFHVKGQGNAHGLAHSLVCAADVMRVLSPMWSIGPPAQIQSTDRTATDRDSPLRWQRGPSGGCVPGSGRVPNVAS